MMGVDITQPRTVKAGTGYVEVAPLADKIDASGDCWEWTGAKQSDGYGSVTYERQAWLAHRLIWTLLVGEIPDGLTLDHLCRNLPCVNPDHLEPVTRNENVWRGANPRYRTVRHNRCSKGHLYVGDNIMVCGRTNRCRQCKTEYDRER